MSAMANEMNNPMFLILGSDDRPDREPKDARITLRLPARQLAFFEALANANGRSMGSEIQAAMYAHEHLYRLALVLDQKTQEARKAASNGIHGVTGESAASMAELAREDLARIWAASFPDAAVRHARGFPEVLWSAGS
jgi:hypothetical protein